MCHFCNENVCHFFVGWYELLVLVECLEGTRLEAGGNVLFVSGRWKIVVGFVGMLGEFGRRRSCVDRRGRSGGGDINWGCGANRETQSGTLDMMFFVLPCYCA